MANGNSSRKNMILLYEHVKISPFGLIETSAYMDERGNIVKFERRKSVFSKEFLTLILSRIVNRLHELLT